ncbi:hypothetical protein ACFRKE_02260 [Kitasatospora indigofera]|uniref:hypothetical protein n=1 Tax=Kitasatospora indigofera TaxID=67307 RepID=UPI003687BEDD
MTAAHGGGRPAAGGGRGLLPAVSRQVGPRPAVPSVVTPLGTLALSAVIDHWRLPDRPLAAFAVPGGGRILRWEHRIAAVELLITPFRPVPYEDGLPLDGCWSAVWLVAAHARLGRVALTAAFDPLPDGVAGDAAPGQGVAAVEYWNGTTGLTLGSDDEEGLCFRAARGVGLPSRWAGCFDDVHARPARVKWGVEYLAGGRGLRWALPPLERGEDGLMNVVACWRDATPRDEHDASTWFGALAGPGHVLDHVAAAARG